MVVISAQAMDPSGTGTTGKFLVLYDDDIDIQGMMGALRDVAGITAAAASDFVAAVPADDQSMVFDSLGVAVVSADRDQFSALQQSTRDGPARRQVAMEPDRIVHAISDDYVRGYRDGVQDMSNQLLGAEQSDPTFRMQQTGGTTWGLQAIGIGQAPGLGKDISVAILDTGIDRDHPDLAGRVKADQSFIKDEAVQDASGHGTHCAGTVAGPVKPASGPRYGVASEASLLVGKVLSNTGHGSDGSVLQGINWAMEAGAHIISMSLGAFVPRGATSIPAFTSRRHAARSPATC